MVPAQALKRSFAYPITGEKNRLVATAVKAAQIVASMCMCPQGRLHEGRAPAKPAVSAGSSTEAQPPWSGANLSPLSRLLSRGRLAFSMLAARVYWSPALPRYSGSRLSGGHIG